MDERLELELDLASDGGDGFLVAVRSPAGDEHGEFALAAGALLGQRAQLQSTILASAVTSRAAVSEIEVPVRLVGETLFRALFSGDVYAAYKASLAVAAERGAQLRVVLRTQVPELAALPWEMLYDPDAEAYLCQREPLVRHVSVPSLTKPLTVTPPLRILGVVSAPTDKARLDVEGEKQRLRDALAPLGARVLLRWVDGGRWTDVQRELVAGTWHVLHFVGHGGFDDFRQEGVLVLENDQRTSDLVGADRFSDLLTLQVPPLQLVVLNSCAGGQSASRDVFSSTAATLIRTGVSAVVAMQFAVSDPAAKAFAAGFYQAIAHDRALGEAVRIGRIGIRGTSEETLEWITPVLYLRGDDAPLFTVLPGEDDDHDNGSGLTPEDAALEVASLALYDQAVARVGAEQYADALPLLDSLLDLRPGYRDAVEIRRHTAAQVRAAEAYDTARAAEARSDWAAAATAYDAVLEVDPDRPGVRERRDHCRTRERVQQSGGGGGGSPPPRWRRWAVIGTAVLVLVGGLVAAVVWQGGGDPGGGGSTGDGEAPAPFESAALWSMAEPYFEPDECSVPQSSEEAPLAWDLPWSELLKCRRADGTYTGTFLCADDQSSFDEVREAFLGEAVGETEPVTGLPADRDDPYPLQVAFHHAGVGAGRVFWDDVGVLCSAELQTEETDLGVVVGHWTGG